MNVGEIFHNLSVWAFRIAIAGGAIAVGYVALTGDRNMPGARMAASPSATQATGDAATGGCQPIGHTANDELVYSMDCEGLPAASGGGK